MGEILNTYGGLLLTSFASIIAISNPFGAMPIFAGMTADNSADERRTIAKKAALYMVIILAIFLLAGTYIKSFFGISLSGIRVAGGLILLQSAFGMLKSGQTHKRISKEGEEFAKEKDDISFTPLAMPLLAGPGSIAVVLGLSSNLKGPIDFAIVTGAIVICAVIAYFILRLGPLSSKYIGPAAMNAITRMMGFIVMAMAVQFILSGIKDFFL